GGVGRLGGPRAGWDGEQGDGRGHAEEDERPRLRLGRDPRERSENEERRLVWQQAAMQRPPATEWVAPHLKSYDEVNEGAVHEVLGDRRDRDGPRLAYDLGAGTRDEEERRRRGTGGEHGCGRVEAPVVPALTYPAEVQREERRRARDDHRVERSDAERRVG